MNILVPVVAVSPLRQRLIDEMEMRRFGRETQRNYIRDVGRFATFLGRSPDTATAEEVRRFQVAQSDQGVPVPTMNSIVSALRFFFLQTLDRPDLARKLVRMKRIRKLPIVLSPDEVARLLGAVERGLALPCVAVTYRPLIALRKLPLPLLLLMSFSNFAATRCRRQD
jgi:integrase/recombinase XerD